MNWLRHRIHRPSPALIVALLALFVATSGTSYAAVALSNDSVRSKHIKDNEVRRADVAKNAISAAQVADGSLLAADFKAGQLSSGPQGPQGIPGPKGDAGATSVVVRAASGSGTVRADCLPGERATGGGAHSVNGHAEGSAPVSHPLAFFSTNTPAQGYTPTSWSAHAQNDAGNDADVTVWVICAAP